MVTSYFTPDLAVGHIPRSTERIASVNLNPLGADQVSSVSLFGILNCLFPLPWYSVTSIHCLCSPCPNLPSLPVLVTN